MEKRFAFVVEGEVFMVWTFDPTDTDGADPAKMEMIIAGMSSDPKVIEFTPDKNVTVGWTHNGVDFIPPQ